MYLSQVEILQPRERTCTLGVVSIEQVGEESE